MNKCSVSNKPHLLCNHLIISKVYFFDVNASWWGCFKGVSSLADLCLSGNVDDLLDYITSSVRICLLPESNDSSNDVSNESSEDNDSDEIIIVFCAIRTRSSYLISSIRTRFYSLIASLWRNVSSNSSLASFIICVTSETCECWFLSGWNWQARERYYFFILPSVEDSFKPRTK